MTVERSKSRCFLTLNFIVKSVLYRLVIINHWSKILRAKTVDYLKLNKVLVFFKIDTSIAWLQSNLVFFLRVKMYGISTSQVSSSIIRCHFYVI